MAAASSAARAGRQSTGAPRKCQRGAAAPALLRLVLLATVCLVLPRPDGLAAAPANLTAAIEANRAFKDSLFRHDDSSPLRPDDVTGFQGLRYFAPDPAWYIEGQLHRYGRVRQIQLADTGGTTITVERFGRFLFQHDGKPFWLEVFRSLQAGDLTVYFTDESNGDSTYAAGRYAAVSRSADGVYVLDFNGSYNPYCAYNEDYICPLPPAQNHLPFAVTAGELNVGPDLAHGESGP